MRSKALRFVSGVAAIAVLMPSMLLVSCSSLVDSVNGLNARTLTDTMLEDYFASPDTYNWKKVCEDGYNPPSLDKDQAELLRYVAGKVKYSYGDTVVDETGKKAKVTYRFTKVPDVANLDVYEGTVQRLKNEIKSLDTVNLDITFQCIFEDGDWEFHSLSKFGKYFVRPFCDLNVTDREPEETTTETTEPVSEDTGDIKDKYLASVWYGIETGNPLDSYSVSDAYAVQNVFYFTYPVSGTFETVLKNSEGKEILKHTVEVKDQVTVVCDFSAGHEGWGTFDPGKYCVELYYGGQLIATSDYLTVN
ncbi:MAG: hypothetical protein J6X33_07735 [Clostridiales bacterium]|nr:hypothetical protein [Clostridiales bacterium]